MRAIENIMCMTRFYTQSTHCLNLEETVASHPASNKNSSIKAPELKLKIGSRKKWRSSGVTLLELLVAMAIFVIIAGAAYAGLHQGTAVAKKLQEKRLFWQRLESVHTLIQIDMEQARDLASRTSDQTIRPFYGNREGDNNENGMLIRFTRGVNNAFHTGPASPIQRVTYRFDEGNLYRLAGSQSDVTEGSDLLELPVLENVESISMRYLAPGNRWKTRWPQEFDPSNQALPDAVEMHLEFPGYGGYRWLFHIGPPH